MTILVTGAAGFIGFHVSRRLLAAGTPVIGVDNLNDYYPVSLKNARLEQLRDHKKFTFFKCDISDHADLCAALESKPVSKIIHLAAQAGVRYSIENPFAYARSNLDGHLSVLEFARNAGIEHVVYASSSSVYGANAKQPFSESDITDSPVSLYGATKKSDELLSESYARLYSIPLTGLRFFTVYGPWGRPDMAYWIFTDKIMRGEPINVFNEGRMGRDFTYIDDIVDGVLAALDHPPTMSRHFHQIYNLGNDRPEELMTLINQIEAATGKTAIKTMMGMQPGDVERTWADISRARAELGFDPKTSLQAGIDAFVKWRRAHAGAFHPVNK